MKKDSPYYDETEKFRFHNASNTCRLHHHILIALTRDSCFAADHDSAGRTGTAQNTARHKWTKTREVSSDSNRQQYLNVMSPSYSDREQSNGQIYKISRIEGRKVLTC